MPATSSRPQLLHLVFGGELDSLADISFRDLNKLDLVGVFPNYATAAHMRYFIVHLHRLLDPESAVSVGRADASDS